MIIWCFGIVSDSGTPRSLQEGWGLGGRGGGTVTCPRRTEPLAEVLPYVLLEGAAAPAPVVIITSSEHEVPAPDTAAKLVQEGSQLDNLISDYYHIWTYVLR